MENVELVPGHFVDRALDGFLADKMAGIIHLHAAPPKARRILDFAARNELAVRELAKRLFGIELACGVRSSNRHAIWRHRKLIPFRRNAGDAHELGLHISAAFTLGGNKLARIGDQRIAPEYDALFADTIRIRAPERRRLHEKAVYLVLADDGEVIAERASYLHAVYRFLVAGPCFFRVNAAFSVGKIHYDALDEFVVMDLIFHADTVARRRFADVPALALTPVIRDVQTSEMAPEKRILYVGNLDAGENERGRRADIPIRNRIESLLDLCGADRLRKTKRNRTRKEIT